MLLLKVENHARASGMILVITPACLLVNFMMKVRTSTPVPWVRLQLRLPWSDCASPAADGFQALAIRHLWCCIPS